MAELPRSFWRDHEWSYNRRYRWDFFGWPSERLTPHTADNCPRLHQQPIPCRLREAAFSLDGLLEHDTELDPRICYTDTHGFTEVVMATAALLGFELAPRITSIWSVCAKPQIRRRAKPP